MAQFLSTALCALVFMLYSVNSERVDVASARNEPEMQLGNILQDLGQNPAEVQIDELIEEIDADGDGQIDFDEYLSMLTQNVNLNEMDIDIEKAREVFDKANRGEIGVNELRDGANELLGEDLSDEQLNILIQLIKEIGIDSARANSEEVPLPSDDLIKPEAVETFAGFAEIGDQIYHVDSMDIGHDGIEKEIHADTLSFTEDFDTRDEINEDYDEEVRLPSKNDLIPEFGARANDEEVRLPSDDLIQSMEKKAMAPAMNAALNENPKAVQVSGTMAVMAALLLLVLVTVNIVCLCHSHCGVGAANKAQYRKVVQISSDDECRDFKNMKEIRV